MIEITREFILSSIDELIRLGSTALQSEQKSPGERIIAPDYLDGPNYTEFKSKLKLFNERYLKEHPLYQEIKRELKSYSPISACKNIVQHLQTIREDELFLSQFKESIVDVDSRSVTIDKETDNLEEDGMVKPQVFVVYGHDTDTLSEVELFLRRIECDPIILQNMPSGGLTIIEKIEEYAKNVEFGIVLYTACDEGRLRESGKELLKRARQNVVFEHGFLISKISRKRVVALVEDGVETPGDVDGVIYVSMSDDDWRQQIMREMEGAGVSIKNQLSAGTGAIKVSTDSSLVWGRF